MGADEAEEFWAATKHGQLLLKRCTACEKVHYYPRAFCPFCMSQKTQWVFAQGGGTIYAYSVARRNIPMYVVAYVRLSEGPILLTNIVDCQIDRVRIGDEVQVTFRTDLNGRAQPYFRPTSLPGISG